MSNRWDSNEVPSIADDLRLRVRHLDAELAMEQEAIDQLERDLAARRVRRDGLIRLRDEYRNLKDGWPVGALG